MIEPQEVPPPDNTGTDAFVRFTYQAHVAFRFCLNCARIGDVKCVVPEHFEDLAIELEGAWRLTQIKTRDAERGPWELTDLLASSGGAFRSIVRSYRALREAGVTVAIEYEVRLEGAIRRGDAAEQFTLDGPSLTEETRERCRDRLDLNDEDMGLLDLIVVRAREPSRETIVAHNLRLLGAAAPHLRHEQLEAIYDDVIALIEAAMRGDLLDGVWPAAVLEPGSVSEVNEAQLEAKRLDPSNLGPLLEGLGETRTSALRRFTNPDTLRATALEEKLVLAGAAPPVVEDAKQLRANAAFKEAELRASSLLFDDAQLVELRERVRLSARAIVAGLTTPHDTADGVWAEVMATFPGQSQTLDPDGLFKADPPLLVGQLCQVSDLCDFDWGVGDE